MLRRCHADACDLHARPGSEWARQNLDLYESCWLSLTGYSQCYVPEWLTMMAARYGWAESGSIRRATRSAVRSTAERAERRNLSASTGTAGTDPEGGEAGR